MWLVTTIGFYSVVAHRDLPDTLLVRGRVKADLETLKKEVMPSLSKVIYVSDADYPYRATISRADFNTGMVKLVDMIVYDNFKSAVASKQGFARANVYHKVWSVLLALEANKKRIQNYWTKGLNLLPPPKEVDEAEQLARFNSIMNDMNDDTRTTGTER